MFTREITASRMRVQQWRVRLEYARKQLARDAIKYHFERVAFCSKRLGAEMYLLSVYLCDENCETIPD